MTDYTLVESVMLFFLVYVFGPIYMILSRPIGIIVEAFFLSSPTFFRSPNTPAKHRKKVEGVQEQVQAWNRNGRKNLMCTGRPGWKSLSVRSLVKSNMTCIMMELNEIIDIDVKDKILRLEPGMVMGDLTDQLLDKGWTIPVIPEFETLSVGGCICGTGIETTSHKYGLFADTCIEYEVVLPDGTLVNCSKDKNSDLFHAIPWSHGSIGFLTAVTIPLIPAKKYAKLEYVPTTSVTVASDLLKTEGADFVEGIMFGLHKFVFMLGTMVDQAESGKKINRLNSWYKPWFYKHAESYLTGQNLAGRTEYVPLREYYHRHQRSYFWELKYGAPFGNNLAFRLLFGWVYPMSFPLSKILLPMYARELAFERNHVLQDFMVPITKMEEIITFAHKEVEIYPLWLCPVRFFNKPTMAHSRGDKDELYVDIGIYGTTKKVDTYDRVKSTRKFEKVAIENHGYQFLYADCFLTRDELNKMFDMEHYDRVREKYNCNDAFPHVYDKVSAYARK